MYIPSLQEALAIVEKNDAFLHRMERVNGMNVHIFDYRLASYKDFMENPGSLEMRGLTFVEHFGRVDCIPHLTKFFNWGEQYAVENVDLEKNKVQRVQTKEDGSMMVPVMVIGNHFFKTRKTFFSEHAKRANEFVEKNPNYSQFIYAMDGLNLVPIFEFVSPFFQIVLPQQKDNLVLLQIRNKTTGEYIQDISKIADAYDIPYANTFEVKPIDFYLELAKFSQNMEGWVIQFDKYMKGLNKLPNTLEEFSHCFINFVCNYQNGTF